MKYMNTGTKNSLIATNSLSLINNRFGQSFPELIASLNLFLLSLSITLLFFLIARLRWALSNLSLPTFLSTILSKWTSTVYKSI